LAIPSTPDLELTRTVAASVEELGYDSVWTNDAPPGDGIASAIAMLGATEHIRVGIGAVPFDRRSVAEVAEQLKAADLPLERLVIVAASGMAGTVASMRATIAALRGELGGAPVIGLAALGPRMCRLAGEIADLVLLNWMGPDRIRWARDQIRRGAGRRAAGLGAPEPQVACYVRVSLGQGAALRVAAEASRYGQVGHYGRNFAAQGVSSVGIATADPERAAAQVEPYDAVLDETVLRVIAPMPATAQPELDEAVEALGVVTEAATRLAPAGPAAPPAQR
jgi:alkanesulfonate monooxygenase SsuD/methylene tetrahydromethanopterin reductase-like flavin-dependent oxidoreductase (luciferase family)